MNDPLTPIHAATHHDPYPYYAGLVADKPIYYDQEMKMWVASSAEAVSDVLRSDYCFVRPVAEPVPTRLIGSPAGQVFCHLVRMNDGTAHSQFKPVVAAALEWLNPIRIADQSNRWASFLISQIQPFGFLSGISDFAFQLTLYVVASLLGVPTDMLSQTNLWLKDFVRSLIPTNNAQQIEQGKISAGHLLGMLRSLLSTSDEDGAPDLLHLLSHMAKGAGQDDENRVIANAIGFLSQAYEATAGLISNTLVVLAKDHHIQKLVMSDLGLLTRVIDEVIRYDPPIQNTRRFLGHDRVILGKSMKQGDIILLILAAANRDPLINSNSTEFDIYRQQRASFTFGLGTHTCPGQKLAIIIARTGIEQLIKSGIDLKQLGTLPRTFFPSANARIHMFGSNYLT